MKITDVQVGMRYTVWEGDAVLEVLSFDGTSYTYKWIEGGFHNAPPVNHDAFRTQVIDWVPASIVIDEPPL